MLIFEEAAIRARFYLGPDTANRAQDHPLEMEVELESLALETGFFLPRCLRLGRQRSQYAYPCLWGSKDVIMLSDNLGDSR